MLDMTSWKSGPGNFVCAGGDCFASLMSNFMHKYDGMPYINNDTLKDCLMNTINRYLYSFGTGLSYKTKRMSKNHPQKIASEVDKIVAQPFMSECKLYIDSGGFQVAMGAVKTEDMPSFIDKYHQFLKDNHQKFTYAFTLDLPPGPSSASSIFESYNQIEELNRSSYKASASLPQEIKDKMIYVHHFRTPSLFNTWSKFLWEENLAEGYKNFATGGIVANSSTDISIPIIIYTIPLSEILKYAIAKGMTSFNFHVLGGANYIDVFYHKLFSYHIKKAHNVDVNITYDSSAIFKGLAIGRFIPVFKDNGNLIKMDLRSKALHMKFDGDHTIESKLYELLNEIADAYGFKKLNPETDPVYDLDRGTFSRSVHMYLICYMFRMYRLLEQMSQKMVEDIYPLYLEGKQDEFDENCTILARKFNQGKNTKKSKAKVSSLFKSLQILTNMDTEYNKFLIHKFMSNDDISMMCGSERTIKF